MSQSGKPDSAASTSGKPAQTGTGGEGGDHTERNLDEALEETFPASDPISIKPDPEDEEDRGDKAAKADKAGKGGKSGSAG